MFTVSIRDMRQDDLPEVSASFRGEDTARGAYEVALVAFGATHNVWLSDAAGVSDTLSLPCIGCVRGDHREGFVH